jgi:hypothetical protein
MKSSIKTMLLSLIAFVFAMGTTQAVCPLECFHDGECKSDDDGIFYWCECPTTSFGGYQGLRCEEPFSTCSDNGQRSWKCLNGGECREDKLGCTCPRTFKGAFCEVYDGPCKINGKDLLIGGPCEKKGMSTGAIIGIVAGSLAGAAFFFFAGRFMSRRRTGKETDTATKHYPQGSTDVVVEDL